MAATLNALASTRPNGRQASGQPVEEKVDRGISKASFASLVVDLSNPQCSSVLPPSTIPSLLGITYLPSRGTTRPDARVPLQQHHLPLHRLPGRSNPGSPAIRLTRPRPPQWSRLPHICPRPSQHPGCAAFCAKNPITPSLSTTPDPAHAPVTPEVHDRAGVYEYCPPAASRRREETSLRLGSG